MEEQIQILCHNTSGFPNDKNNIHKLRKVKQLLDKKDAAIILETGTNKNNNLLIPNEDIQISKENKMPLTTNHQYQHNGSGTAILINERYNHMSAREIFNNHKNVASIIIN